MASIERETLNWLCNNRTKLCAYIYSISRDDVNAANLGRRIVLPSSFGVKQLLQDGLERT